MRQTVNNNSSTFDLDCRQTADKRFKSELSNGTIQIRQTISSLGNIRFVCPKFITHYILSVDEPKYLQPLFI